ncbi:MAG: PEGA domain-containing protein [Methylotenera sp.]|nr:PEGA domain-containing protein [Oligoflexia bacterium]
MSIRPGLNVKNLNAAGRTFHHPLALLALWAICAFSGALTGCAGRRYDIKSDPSEADIYINDVKIGKTPMQVPFKDLPETANLKLEVVREGYGSVLTFVPGPTTALLEADLLVKIPKKEDEIDKINRQVGQIIKAHQLMIANRNHEAIRLIDEAIHENPKYIYPLILKATVLFMSRNFKEALVYWEKVLSLDPVNVEAKRMVSVLKTDRKIASELGTPETGNTAGGTK